MFKCLQDVLTEADGVSHDILRWAAVGGFTTGIGLSIHDVAFLHNAFNIQNYGIGYGAMLASLGGAIGMKGNN